MLGEELQSAVGPGKPNRRDDVRIVQRLLDRNTVLVGGIVIITGTFDQSTANAIVNYQRRVMRQAFPTGVIMPRDETFWRLSETRPQRMLAGARGGILRAPFIGNGRLVEDDFIAASKALACEIRAIKAVTSVEAPRGAFDKMGRPTILFERHLFSRLTLRQYDGRYPFISNPVAGGYSFPELDEYVRLQQAYALNATAALKATSWGLFQILGANHVTAGFSTVDQFVQAMCRSAGEQLAAFVMFVRANPDMLSAIQEKNWAQFARYYNGPQYMRNHYDTKLAEKYAQATD